MLVVVVVTVTTTTIILVVTRVNGHVRCCDNSYDSYNRNDHDSDGDHGDDRFKIF
ncbi:hypothetical protein GLYMA_12G179650v4 [Glycine max]|nr:hypothetical protein GLYMA_12G179650v4 [Glycine max]KAH1143749.1 hypothetical protein GYH30_034123 [Glycine max]